MPVTLQLLEPSAEYAFQEQIPARVVFRRAAGEASTTVPRPLDHPEVLSLWLRHEDGAAVDLSPPAGGPAPPGPPELLHSTREEEPVELVLPPPPRAGAWTVELSVKLGAAREAADAVRLVVRPPAARALCPLGAIHQPGEPTRVLQLTADGVLLAHPLARNPMRALVLGDGSRLGRLEGAPGALLAAAALPGVAAAPAWLVLQQGDRALARWTGEPPREAAPLALRREPEPPALWLGAPLGLDDEGHLALAWAVGAVVRVAVIEPSGRAGEVREAALPGPVKRGLLLADAAGGLHLIVHVAEPPEPLPSRLELPRVGSTEELSDPPYEELQHRGLAPLRPRPPPQHADWLWALPIGSGREPPGRPRRIASLPAGTHALAGWSSGDAPASLWVVEHTGGRWAATQVQIEAGRLGLSAGALHRHPIRTRTPPAGEPLALALPSPGELRLLFAEKKQLVIAGTAGPAMEAPLDGPPPDLACFAAGHVVLHDPQRGLRLR